MKLFRRRRAARTGHALDDALLDELRARTDLEQPRHWLHYLYVGDESTARAAADQVISDGWDLDRVEPTADGRRWVVVAEQYDTVLTPERVAAARRFFEDLAARCRGGDYDGWEAQA